MDKNTIRKDLESAVKRNPDTIQILSAVSGIDEGKLLKFLKGDDEALGLMELAEQIYYLWMNGYEAGKSTGWPYLDKLYTVRQREFTVITGIPSSGKSAWLDHLICNLALYQNWSFGIISPENYPFERYVAKFCEIYAGMRIWN